MSTIAFDIYDTLIDTQGIKNQLQEMVGGLAPSFAQIWRDKQLEYSFRRGLMEDYVDFPSCTAHALEYTDQLLCTGLNKQAKQQLLTTYKSLPPFDDSYSTLENLKSQGHRLYALTNGLPSSVESLFQTAGIAEFFEQIVSVDAIKTFKPDPRVYEYLLQVTGTRREECWMISGNTFDVLGAHRFGLKTVWVKRSDRKVMDPWGYDPDLVIHSLSELTEKLR